MDGKAPVTRQDWNIDALLDECDRQEKFCREHGFPNPSLDTVDVRALLRAGARATVEDRVAAQQSDEQEENDRG